MGLLLVGLTLLVALDRVAVKVIQPPRRPPARRPDELGLPWEDVELGGPYPLLGWLVLPGDGGTDEGRPAVLLSHGWAANAGVLLSLAGSLARSGHPVLVYDYRSHGRSADAPWVTVRQYREDTLTAAAWLRERFPGRPLVLGGHSMGGAASVLAAAQGTVEVDGLVLLAAPADVLEVTAGYLRERGLPGGLMVRVLRPFWTARIRERNRRLVPSRRIREVGAPVLVVHPEEDRRIPVSHAELLARNGRGELTVVPGAAHTDVLERRETAEAVLGLLERVGTPAA